MNSNRQTEPKNSVYYDAADDYEEYAEGKKERKPSPRLRERFNAAADELHKKDLNYRFSYALNFVIFLLLIVVCALAIREFVLEPTVVEGESMQNTLINGERVFVEKVSYWFCEPKRGDIVIVHYPKRGKTCFVKRVIALPGEVIEIHGKDVFINGEKLDETQYAWYDPSRTPIPIRTSGCVNGKYVVPEGYVFVMGDNRCNSHDSRFPEVGAIPHNQILGKARFVIWPFDRIRSPYK